MNNSGSLGSISMTNKFNYLNIDIASMRLCISCGSDKYYANGCCYTCYHRLFINPKHCNRIASTRIKFKDKRVYLKENPRKGICSQCGKTDCRTNIHHIKYHDNDPLKDTIELCVICHTKKHQ